MPVEGRASDAEVPEVPAYLQTSSGGWDDLDVTFRDPYFGYDPAYVNDAGDMMLSMIVDFVTEDGDVGENGVIARQRITIGSGWEQVDGGKRVERVNGRAKGFNRGSYMGLLVDKCMSLASAEMMDRFHTTGLQPNDAGFWEGFHSHMVQTKLPMFKGETEARERLLPDGGISWAGAEVVGGGSGSGAKPAKKAAAKKAPAAVAPAPAAPAPVTATPPATELREAVVAIALTSESDEQFIMRCYDEVPGLDADADAMALVDDVESAGCVWLEYGPGGAGRSA
jgi:hypothetical protein